jgi:hypothetical protein
VSREHIPSEPVRSYLLGILDESSAASIEERYFTDRGFFLFVQAVETALIEDYLAGRLAPSTRERFESRYLSVPDLHRRLNEVRERQVPARIVVGQIRYARLRLVAAAVLVCLGGSAFWLYRDRMRFDSLPMSTGTRPVLATISLSPGLLKDHAARSTQLSVLSARGDVRLVLDLPGQATQIFCSAQVSVASPDGTWKRVWSTPQPVWSMPSQGGQQLALILDASLLGRGDYLVEVAGTDKQVQETYSFRVSPM